MSEQTLNQLLTEMDGFDSKKGVVIGGGEPPSLDKALLRQDDSSAYQMELPDLQGRKAIQVHLKKVRHEEIDIDARRRPQQAPPGRI